MERDQGAPHDGAVTVTHTSQDRSADHERDSDPDQSHLTDADLGSLLTQALGADDARLHRQALHVGLTRAAITDRLRSQSGELASVVTAPPESAQEAYDEAALALSRVSSGRGLRSFRRYVPFARRRLRALAEAVSSARTQLHQATEQARFEVQLESAKGTIRSLINEHAGGRYQTTLSVIEHEALMEMDDIRYAVDTVARGRLEWLLENSTGGSIGLAGPRGAGKSTLMRIACAESDGPSVSSNTRETFPVMVAAPVEFEPRDFVLHLFAEICQEVLGRTEVERLRRARSAAPLILMSWPVRLLVMCGAALACLAGILLILATAISIKVDVRSQYVWGALLITTALLGLLLYRRFLMDHAYRTYSLEGKSLFSYSPIYGSGLSLEDLARTRLTDIWFQQSFTTGWSGTFKMPVGGLEAGLDKSRDLAKQQMSLPDIVSEIRRLVKKIAENRQVRIGIDELDKIEPPEAAWRFMNEIKVLFLIPGCFFLVSVSEDAMSSFQRRGLPFRDVFDSSFDDVVPVGYLDTAHAIALVERRIVGLRVPFVLLCHCMAGGLARDLIRAARDVVTLNARSPGDSNLSEICGRLVRADLTGKGEAAMVACRRLSPGRRSALISWLHEASRRPWTSAEILAWLDRAETNLRSLQLWNVSTVDGAADSVAAVAIATEFAAFALFSATLLEVFVTERPSEFWAAAAAGEGSGRIDELVKARQDFSVDPHLAWDGIIGFRSGHGLDSGLRFPRLTDESDCRAPRLSSLAISVLERLATRGKANNRPD